MTVPTEARIDKWLWAVRLYKTRSEAAEACLAGHVKLGGDRVKPARTLRGGETLTVLAGGIERTVRVLSPIDRRVGAARVPESMADLTPPELYEQARQAAALRRAAEAEPSVRPTKKQRRLIEEFLSHPGPDEDPADP